LSEKVKIRIYRTSVFPVVLLGCELREEHRLRVFENGAQENILTEEA
jgi:hypothetical protein